MCKISDRLTLCTCSPEALKTADYTWSYSHYEEPDSYIEGMYLPSHVSWRYENAIVSGDEICRELNSRNCFDFELVPKERDIPVFKRALEYQTEGRVIGIARIATDTYAALVRGEKMYRVTMRIDTRHGIHSSCECPYYSDHRICKHVLAVSVEMRAYSDYVFSLPVDVEAAELQQSLKNAKASDLVAELKKLQTRMLAGEGANILPRLELILKLINPELLKEDFDIYNRVVYLYMRFTQLAALSGAERSSRRKTSLGMSYGACMRAIASMNHGKNHRLQCSVAHVIIVLQIQKPAPRSRKKSPMCSTAMKCSTLRRIRVTGD